MLPKQTKLTRANLNNSNATRLVAIERQEYEYIKRLLLLYKANFRQTGECHYSPILNLLENKKP